MGRRGMHQSGDGFITSGSHGGRSVPCEFLKNPILL